MQLFPVWENERGEIMKIKFFLFVSILIYLTVLTSSVFAQIDEYGAQGSNRYLFGCNGVQGNDVRVPNSSDFFLIETPDSPVLP